MAKKMDALGDRMKGYENISRIYLTRRVPVIIRLDGKTFHTFTRGFQKPFDRLLMATMQETMKYLCENIQGCVFAYTQSDEITLVLTDYATIKTDAWFGYNIQKMASIAASLATIAFNTAWSRNVDEWAVERIPDWFEGGTNDPDSIDQDALKQAELYSSRIGKALFDARVFSIPKEEVVNCLIWRQQDATRNSIEAVGQANFSNTQLHGKTCDNIQDMLWKEKGINWNDFPVDCKRGACCFKTETTEEVPNPHENGAMVTVTRRKWKIDTEPPIFTQGKEYVERWL